ncbi:MAG: hypothetical protein ACT4QD_20230 [Acidobacteriota bacterium]
MVGEQREQAEEVLLVQLDDLELHQEQLGERKCQLVDAEAIAEVDRVAHLEQQRVTC